MKSGGPGRLIIHCGVQKTASTAFHHFLQRNHAALHPWLNFRTPEKGSPTRDLELPCDVRNPLARLVQSHQNLFASDREAG